MAGDHNFKKPNKPEIMQKLNELQFYVTQECGTEPPFENMYWNNKQPGLYVDIVTGEPLFSSVDKFDSGTGWPSFTRPVEEARITYHEDRKLLSKRIEVRSKIGDSHLGHVFDDGPQPTGKRYCVNSAALEFIPVSELEKRGYGAYLKLFESHKTPEEPKMETALATFAGGCFWCMEPPFKAQDGVLSVISGYMGGNLENPSYEQVCTGKTGHAEVIHVEYDPEKVSFDTLLEVFWRNINPTTLDRQFVDIGSQYRPEIFYHSEEQRIKAEDSRRQLESSGRFKDPILTKITPASRFYPAEDYHQDYYKKNPIRYKAYRNQSGREQFLESVWSDQEPKQ